MNESLLERLLSVFLEELNKVLSEFLYTLAQIVPRLIAASIVIVIGWILGRFLGRLISFILYHTGVEKSFKNTSIGRRLDKAGYTLTYFFDLLARLSIYLLSIALAIKVLGYAEAVFIAQRTLELVNQLAMSSIVLLIGIIVVEKIMSIVYKLVEDHSIREKIILEAIHLFLLGTVLVVTLIQLKVDLQPLITFLNSFAMGAGIGIGISAVFLILLIYKEEFMKNVESIKAFIERMRGVSGAAE